MATRTQRGLVGQSAPLARSRLSREEFEARWPDAQVPTHFTIPSFITLLTRGPQVAELNADVGFEPDADQQVMLDLKFAVRPDNESMPLFSVFDWIVSRQNMKTAGFEMCDLGDMYVRRVRRVLWSSHEEKSSGGAHKHLTDLIRNSYLMDYQPRTRNEGFYFANGQGSIVTGEIEGDGRTSRTDFQTRTKDAGRGGTADVLYVDEEYALTWAHEEALGPVLAAVPHRQRVGGSSAARPESDVERARVKIGRAGTGPARAVYVEFCAPAPAEACDAGDRCTHEYRTPGCALGKPELVKQANPAYGRRITAESIDTEWFDLQSGAGRERMGWHDEPAATVSAIRADDWMRAADQASLREGSIALGVDVSPDERFATFGVAGRRADTLGHVEAVEVPEGRVADSIAMFAEKRKPIVTVIDGASPAARYVTELLTRGFVRVSKVDDDVPKGGHRLLVMSAGDISRACGAFVADVRSAVVRHADQPGLNAAVLGAKTRPLMGGFAWDRKDSSVNITPLVAVTLARHGSVVFGAAKVKRSTWAALG